MTMPSLLDAYDLVAHSEVLLLRLTTAFAELSRKQGLKDEKDWLEQAINRVTAAREGVGDLLSRVTRLPEMEAAREEQSRSLQSAAVDAVERLQAGITFHAGARAPLLEALYGKLKLPIYRRADKADFEKFCADFEKRLNTGYAKRMFAEPSLAVVKDALEQVRSSFTAWRNSFLGEPLGEAEARQLRDELDACARRVDLPIRQARLLAEAALSPLKDFYESTNIAQRPRKRSLRPAVTETADGEALPGDDDAPDAPAEDEVPPEDEAPAPEPEPEVVAEAAEPVAPRRRGRPAKPQPDAE
jgi:hypothetical protein